ncbi:MAG TPA: thioredoxin-dependent thiol peroxidase [Gaiellaceae bacterium]|nr:thioredoxin-dependent thiol peroxidase [Gaiellaceae bacterium]
MVREGEPAPDFTLRSDTGEAITLSDLRGRVIVLYFYPKDDTPGCTTQACSFRDAYAEFEDRGIVVLGVSPDTAASHARFREKHELPFTLLADPDHEVAGRYGVWVERTIRGKTSMGIKRSTFLVDADGTVAKAMIGVRPEGHAEEVLAALPA